MAAQNLCCAHTRKQQLLVIVARIQPYKRARNLMVTSYHSIQVQRLLVLHWSHHAPHSDLYAFHGPINDPLEETRCAYGPDSPGCKLF